MAFDLKNRGATYLRGIQIILETQSEQNVKAYIDGVVVKLKRRGDLFDDLKETYDNLRKYKMMLNPKKVCSIYHQVSCLATWYRLRELILTQRRWRPSNNYNHFEPKEKSISWQA
jgi:hypothetical protein